MNRPLQRAVFLDRDGTINVEKNYLWRIEDFAFIPGVPEAIGRLNRAGFLVVVVTNQAGIARGYFRPGDVDRLHEHIQRQLADSGARIDAYYSCPHHPDYGDPPVACECRKPATGMLLRAAAELGIDLRRSWMIGDKAADIEAGLRAGCHPILVRTGYGEKTAQSEALQAVTAAESLPDAVTLILAAETPDPGLSD